MKDWEKYEKQIFDKFTELFPGSMIAKNQKRIGKFSRRSRQIDILVSSQSIGREILIIIDCKKFNKKIDIKTVESFIGFSEDIGAHIGIMITNVGYSKSAEQRAKNHHKDIQLDIVEFENLEDYYISVETCNLCKDKSLRGLIKWSFPIPIIEDGKVTLKNLGECSYCGEAYVKCQGCGEVVRIGQEIYDVECECSNVFYDESEYIGDGMKEDTIGVPNENYVSLESLDPNQTNLFE